MKKQLLLLLLLPALFAGCERSRDSITPSEEDAREVLVSFYMPCEHYILGFYDPLVFEAEVDTSRDGTLNICLWSSSERSGRRDEHLPCVHHLSEGADAVRYDRLCERYNDVNLQRPHVVSNRLTPKFMYPANNMVSIEVTCEEAYDAQHPAGASLADLCELVAGTPRDFIAEGYPVKDFWDECRALFDSHPEWASEFFTATWGVRVFNKPLSRCTAEDLVLLGHGSYRYCQLVLPRPTGACGALHIRLTDEQGRVYDVKTPPIR